MKRFLTTRLLPVLLSCGTVALWNWNNAIAHEVVIFVLSFVLFMVCAELLTLQKISDMFNDEILELQESLHIPKTIRQSIIDKRKQGAFRPPVRA
jgi:hypothetical protein